MAPKAAPLARLKGRNTAEGQGPGQHPDGRGPDDLDPWPMASCTQSLLSLLCRLLTKTQPPLPSPKAVWCQRPRLSGQLPHSRANHPKTHAYHFLCCTQKLSIQKNQIRQHREQPRDGDLAKVRGRPKQELTPDLGAEALKLGRSLSTPRSWTGQPMVGWGGGVQEWGDEPHGPQAPLLAL